MRRRRDRQRGFTLIETVVALAILALALGALYESFGGVLRSTVRAQWQEAAWALAERKLIEASLRVAPASSTVTGSEIAQLHWSVEVSPIPADLRDGAVLRPMLVKVTIDHPLRPARQLSLETVAVARATP